MMTLAMLALAPAPGPLPRAIGTMAATSMTVVMRIARRRVWLASTMASWREYPLARSWLVASTWRMPFFLTMPTSMNRPNIAYRSIGVWKRTSDSMPKGIVTGNAMRIAIGCNQLSNWAARIRNMNVIDRAKATMK